MIHTRTKTCFIMFKWFGMQDALLEVRYICLFLHLMAVHFDCFSPLTLRLYSRKISPNTDRLNGNGLCMMLWLNFKKLYRVSDNLLSLAVGVSVARCSGYIPWIWRNLRLSVHLLSHNSIVWILPRLHHLSLSSSPTPALVTSIYLPPLPATTTTTATITISCPHYYM